MEKEKSNEKCDPDHTVIKEIAKHTDQEKPLNLEVKIRKHDIAQNKILDYIYEFTDETKYVKISRTADGCIKVFVDVGYDPKLKQVGIVVPAEGLIVPPEGLVINL